MAVPPYQASQQPQDVGYPGANYSALFPSSNSGNLEEFAHQHFSIFHPELSPSSPLSQRLIVIPVPSRQSPVSQNTLNTNTSHLGNSSSNSFREETPNLLNPVDKEMWDVQTPDTLNQAFASNPLGITTPTPLTLAIPNRALLPPLASNSSLLNSQNTSNTTTTHLHSDSFNSLREETPNAHLLNPLGAQTSYEHDQDYLSLKDLLEKKPNDSKTWKEAANFYFGKKDYTKAVGYWTNLINEEPKHNPITYGIARGKTYICLYHFQAGLDDLVQAYSIKPNQIVLKKIVDSVGQCFKQDPNMLKTLKEMISSVSLQRNRFLRAELKILLLLYYSSKGDNNQAETTLQNISSPFRKDSTRQKMLDDLQILLAQRKTQANMSINHLLT